MEPRYLTCNITTATTMTVSNKAGYCKMISINKPIIGNFAIFDGVAGTGKLIGTVTVAALTDNIVPPFDFAFGSGLSIVTSAAFDLTVSYLEYNQGE